MDNNDYKEKPNKISNFLKYTGKIFTETSVMTAQNIIAEAVKGEAASAVINAIAVAIAGALGVPVAAILALPLATGVNTLAGAISKVTIEGLLIDRENTNLSEKEQLRVDDSLVFALLKIRENLNNGLNIRQDDFFSTNVNFQSKAEEIFEGVITKNKIQYQEKKIKFIGNIYANAAFRDDTSVEELHHILEIADRLTYREICILALITTGGKFNTLQEKIGLVFPTEYAYQPGYERGMGDGVTIHPYFEKNSDFYFLNQELKRLNELDLIGQYYWFYPVNVNKISKNLVKNRLPHSVFLYDFSNSANPFAFKLSQLMGLDEVEKNDLDELNKFFVVPVEVTFKSEEDIHKGGYYSSISKPNYLVNNP